MTKWKHMQLTDKGDTVTDIIDPDAHQVIKDLETEITLIDKKISDTETALKKRDNVIDKLEDEIFLLKKEVEVEYAKSNVLSEEFNKGLVEFNNITKELTELREANQSLGKQFGPLASARNDALQSERKALSQLDKYKDLVINARRMGWNKDEIRKLQKLIGE